MGNLTIKGITAHEYCEKYPEMPTKTLASLMYSETKTLFTSVENARCAIRRVRGKMGEKARNDKANKTMFVMEKKSTNAWENFPESYMAVREPFVLHGDKRILILNDIHLPYHDPNAVKSAIMFGKEYGASCVIINGDLLDFYQLSRYERDPRKRKFSDEMQAGRQFFQVLRYHFPDAQIIYKLGNHEERYEKYFYLKAPELLGCSDFQLDNLLRLGEYRVEYVTDKRIIKAGKLNILHGHETQTRSGGVNPARTMFIKNKENTIVGHFHRASEHVDSSLNNNIVTCVSVGCLCELSPDYMPYNEWVHGFAVVDLEKSGDFHIRNYRIIDGKVY